MWSLLSQRIFGSVGRQASWAVAPFVFNQALRLATNLVLARLLAPEIFGLMLLVNTLRTGTELLSDIGIGQSVVRSKQGALLSFLDSAWTLQVMRGAGLALFGLVAAYPIAQAYCEPELFPILLVVSSLFFIARLQSPFLYLFQKPIRVKSRAAFDTG